MSRPVDPTYVVPVWAPNVNYPVSADPWSATPTKTTHSGAASVGITPKTGVAAQVFNKVINDAYTAIGAGKVADQGILDHVGQLQVLNFGLNVTQTFVDAVWNGPALAWFGIEGTTNCRASFQNGWTWGSQLITGTDTLHNIQVDSTGNMIITTAVTSGIHHEYNFSTSTWTRRTTIWGTGSGTPLTITGKVFCVYEPVSGLWCSAVAANYGGTFAVQVATAPDRATFTGRGSLPNSNVATSFPVNGINLAAGNGVLVACGRKNSGAGSCVWTSSNGGVSWTQQTDIATTFTTGTAEVLHFNAALGLFFYLTADSGTSHKLYTSTNGVAWTLVHSVTTRSFSRLSSVGRIIVANTTSASNLVYSTDGGATWRYTGFGSAAGSTKMVTSGEQLLLLNSGNLVPGVIAGYGHGPVY